MIGHSLSQLSTYQLCAVHSVDYGNYTPLLSEKIADVTGNFEKTLYTMPLNRVIWLEQLV